LVYGLEKRKVNFMFKHLDVDLDKVIALARAYHENTVNDERAAQALVALDNYLNELSLESVKAVQVIAYIGMDPDGAIGDTKEEIYMNQMESCGCLGWSSKSIEIAHTTTLADLDIRIERGLRILGER
jgi:hypothetical protein